MAKPSTQAPSGVVSSVQGRAQVIRQGQETAEALQVGDTLMPGDRLLGSADASLQIAESTAPGAQVWNLAFNEAGTGKGKAAKATASSDGDKGLDDVISAIERGDEQDATAAGLTGGDGAAMGEGLRVDRIVEVVSPQSLNGASNGDGQQASIESTTLLDDGNQAPVFIAGGAGNFDPSTGNYRFTTDEDVPVSGQVKASDADGDTLTFVKGSDPEHGTVVVNADGSWTYTPNKNFNGPDVFTVTVSDGKGGTATSTVYIGVNPVNDPPKFDDPNNPNYDPVTGNYKATTDEDTPVSGKVKASDVDGDPLTFAKGSNPEHGTVVVNADGSWTYTPNKDYNGPDSFTVTVSDGKGGTATSTVEIGVNPVNDPPKFDDPNNPNYDPVTGNYSATTPEDTPVSGQVKAKDVDGDALTFAKGSNPSHGTVTVDANGNWTYTPSKDYNGSDSFTITVSDGHGGTATSTVNIGVTPVNDPPKFNDPNNPNYDPVTGNYKATTDEDKPVSGTVKATDVDGDALTFAKGSNPAHGTVTVDANGNWTYTPNKDYNGSDSFTITVSDGHGGTATSTVNIGVNPVNDPPKFNDPNNPNYDPVTGNYKATTDEDKPVSGTVKATDVDGDALTFAKGSNPAHGSVTVDANGNWTYTPNKDYNGSDSFTITVSDGHGGTATSTVNIGVNPVNDAPKFNDPNNPNYDPVTGNYKVTTDEDKPVSGTVKATDVDGDALSFAKGSNPAHGSVTVDANGNWTYTPNKNYNGSDSFTITVSDGKGGTATSTVNIGVNPANDPPKFDDPNNPNYDPVTGNYKVTTDEDKPVSGTVKATDVDGDALTFAKGSNPAHGTVTVDANGNWTYTPNKDYNGSDSFTITVSDGHGGTATSTVNIGINPVNDAPKFNDPNNPNYDPVTGNYKVTTDEDKPVNGTVKATDADGDALTFAKGSNPAHGTVTVDANGNWTYTPNKDYNGSDSFTITVSDGHGGTATSTVNIGVNPVNDAPKFNDPNNPNYDPVTGNYKVTTDEDKPVSGTVKATDVDGDALTFAKGSNPSHGTVTVDANGNWTYTPNKDYNGSDSFTITVSDGHGGTATSTVNIGVNPVNDAPKFNDPTNPNYDPVTGNYKATTDEDQPVSGTVKATDVDGDALTFAKGSNPAHGTVTVDANGNWTYTPNKDYNGSDSFTITVSDGHGGTATSTVNIGVNPVNDPPKFDDPTNPNYDPVTGNYKVTTDEDKSVSGKVKATDVDGDPLTYAKGSNPAHGSVTVDANGNWTYTPNKDYNGSDQFTVTVSDGKGGTTTSTIYVGITPVNDAPTVTVNGSATVSEEGLAGGNPDNQGSSDTTNAREASGHVTVSDVDSSSVSLTLSGPAGLTSGGVAITWSGNGTAASPLVGSAGGKVILSATIDNSGDYKVTLSGPLDHADTSKEDTRTVNLTINANDGQATTKATLPVIVEDDSPLSGSQNINVSSQTGSQNTNLMLIVDTSGSMKDRLADMTVNGLKVAIKTLIDRYDDLGDVKIQLVTFGDGAKGQSVWMTVEQAKTLINSLQGDGGTNYDGALAAARTAFGTSGKISGGVNVSYFITDGQPSKGYALDSKDETSWETFLGTNKIDSYAIGTGTLNSSNVAAIEPVAYNGITGTEKAAVTLGTNAELGNYLLDTVPVIQKGTLAGLAGADGLQRIESFTASGQIGSSLDNSGKILTIQLKSGGTIQVNLETGDFTLSQPHNATTNETFSYTLVDKDGDRGTGTVSLNAQNTSPEGTDATITLLEDGKHTFSASNFGFHDADAGDKLQAVRIDALPAHGTLTLNGTAVVAGQVISASQLDKLVFTPVANANGSGYAQISFSVQDSHGAFDVSANTLKFNVTPVNDAPEAFASNSGHNLLGLVDLTVNPLLNLSKTQQVAVNDVDNNLVRVEVQVDTLLSLGSLLGDRSSLSISHDAALSAGLKITGNDSRHIVIESIHDGGTVDITQVNKLLATLSYDPADILGVSVDLFPSLKITATDAFGAHDTASVSSSIVAVGVDVAPVITTVETVVHVAGEHAAQLGTEVFQWHLADHPANGGCVDTIHGFDGAARNVGGDVLDLRDLLSGSTHVTGSNSADMDKLLAHLDFDTQSQPGSTVIHVSAGGGFHADASGNSVTNGCNDQQHIVLANVDIRASLGLDAQASDHQIIAELMQRGKLLVDQA